jgi:predicted acyl esterase
MPRRTPISRALLAVLATLALTVALATQIVVQAASAAPAPFTVRAGTQQLEVLGATTLEGQTLDLLRSGTVVASGTVDAQGSLEWRLLERGSYTVKTTSGTDFESAPQQVTRFRAAAPDQSLYTGQTLQNGFNFITTRDGTSLSANVVFPDPKIYGPGPYPTVVEYSGYDPSNPAETTFPKIFNTLGYAYVGVNIRGTGCSGGSFLPFEPVQSLDGYDAIETIAAQSWAKFHKVGMVGISYPGIEQLYVARTRPPHLAAISPLSVIDDTYRGTLWPGGILNTGFATPWASQRASDAKPFGEGWEHDPGGATPAQIQTCADNQLVRDQNPDPVSTIEDNPFYNKTYYQRIDPSRFVGRINVPVYLAGAWQDEQTGGHFPDFLNKFRSAPHLFATMSNGSHTESLSLGEFGRYSDFLDFYVAHRIPTGVKSLVGPALAANLTGVTGLQMPPQPDYSGMTFQQAKHHYNAVPPIRIEFEEGAAKGEPSGAPLPRFTHDFSSWPIPSRQTTRMFLTPHGGLSTSKVSKGKAHARSFSADPKALPPTDYTGSSSAIWGAHPSYDWKQIPKGKGLGWITAPLKKDLVTIGSGSLDVWVKSATKDVDLQATVSDVRPDGTEVYVNSGWLRASHRKLIANRSTPTRPVHTDLRRDAKPMPHGKYRLLRIEILPFAQPFRAGDRLRITLNAPGGAKPLWAFKTLDHGQRVSIATDRRHPSSLVLNAVPGIAVPTKRPPCRSLRSQPCRTYPG